jgi:hypothetical protein
MTVRWLRLRNWPELREQVMIFSLGHPLFIFFWQLLIAGLSTAMRRGFSE